MRADKDSINNGSNAKIIGEYQSLGHENSSALERFTKLSFRFSLIRLAAVVVLGVGLYFTIKFGIVAVAILILLIIMVFAYAVKKQVYYDKLKTDAEIRGRLLVNEISSILRKGNIYYNGEKFIDQSHDYSADLDVFGPFSIFELINRCRTFYGQKYLSKWLSELDTVKEINNRQEAVGELQGHREWRLHFATKLFSVEDGHEVDLADRFRKLLSVDLSWAEHSMLNIYLKALLVIWPILIVAFFMDLSWGTNIAYVVFGINFLVYRQFGKRIGQVQGILARAGQMIAHYSAALNDIFKIQWKSDYIIKETSQFDVTKDESNPVSVLSRLAKIIEHLDYRLNMLVGIILNLFILWDLSVMQRLVKWRTENEQNMDHLFQLIGFFEGLTSLSTFAYNHVEYNYPEVNDSYFELRTEEIGHPLIAADHFVPNDFEMNDVRIQIVTGSNMSGKSTFLRTIGLNMVLAYAGTKVAAKSLQVGHARIISYMRIKDALEENVSTFKAELNRVEKILDMMTGDVPCFVLIDEMLRGTNSKDKLKGSMAITKKIMAHDTYAMIATHDIQLAEMASEYPEKIDNHYFDIDFTDGELSFDYKIRKGICENFNASFLLKQLGVE